MDFNHFGHGHLIDHHIEYPEGMFNGVKSLTHKNLETLAKMKQAMLRDVMNDPDFAGAAESDINGLIDGLDMPEIADYLSVKTEPWVYENKWLKVPEYYQMLGNHVDDHHEDDEAVVEEEDDSGSEGDERGTEEDEETVVKKVERVKKVKKLAK